MRRMLSKLRLRGAFLLIGAAAEAGALALRRPVHGPKRQEDRAEAAPEEETKHES